MNDILAINAHLKYTEHILNVFDNYPDEMTLGEVRNEFEQKFKTRHVLLNQNFGIYRLLPILLIKEVYKNEKNSSEVANKIWIIRDSIAHNDFSMDETGYHFKNDKETFSLSFDEFTQFVHKVENEFYEEKRKSAEETC